MQTCQDIPWITKHCPDCHIRAFEDATRLYLVKFEGGYIWACCLVYNLLNPGELSKELLCRPLGPRQPLLKSFGPRLKNRSDYIVKK